MCLRIHSRELRFNLLLIFFYLSIVARQKNCIKQIKVISWISSIHEIIVIDKCANHSLSFVSNHPKFVHFCLLSLMELWSLHSVFCYTILNSIFRIEFANTCFIRKLYVIDIQLTMLIHPPIFTDLIYHPCTYYYIYRRNIYGTHIINVCDIDPGHRHCS